jgi:DNA topoisomerase-3
VVWKEISGRKIEPEVLQTLLSGETTMSLEFRSREGKEFSAALKLERNDDEGKWLTRFVFSGQSSGSATNGSGDGPGSSAVLGQCPRCGGEVVEGRKGYGCKNCREEDGGCRFVIWKTVAGKQLPEEAVRDLLTKRETGLINGFISKKGKEFSAKLRLDDEDFRTIFVF